MSYLVSFKRAKGIFKKSIMPYKRWFERAEMSPSLEVDGEFYRVLQTTHLFGKNIVNSIVISTEDGTLIQDEGVTNRVLKVFTYLLHLKVNKPSMKIDQRENMPARYDPLYKELDQILIDLTPYLTDDEKSSLRSHLDYYANISHWGDKAREYASQCLDYEKQLTKDKPDILYAEDIEFLRKILNKRDQARCKMFAEVLENALYTRESVRKILENAQYIQHIGDENAVQQVIQEIDAAKKAEKRFINEGKATWDYKKQYLNPNRNAFTIEAYIMELRKENTYEQIVQTNINQFMTMFWIFNKQ